MWQDCEIGAGPLHQYVWLRVGGLTYPSLFVQQQHRCICRVCVVSLNNFSFGCPVCVLSLLPACLTFLFLPSFFLLHFLLLLVLPGGC